MTTRLQTSLTIAAALAAVTLSSLAQTLEILLPGPAPDAATANLGRDVILNPFTSSPGPGVFIATEKASWSDTSGYSIFRLAPTDASSTQFNMEPVDGSLTGASRMAYNPGDGLYAAGFAVTVSGSKGKTSSLQTWKVCRSSETGRGDSGTWGEDDSFNLTTVTRGKTTAYDTRAYGIAIDDLGSVYACGRAIAGQNYHWIVRKKSGETWSTLLNLKTVDGHSIPYDICFVPSGGNNPASAVFVAGLFDSRWTVLRSTDRGDNWQAVGPWPSDGSLASALDMASDSHGNIYVVGVRGRDGANKGWVVRKSEDGGATWTTLLDQPSELNSNSWAARINIDAHDNITVAGAIHTALSQPNWIVVQNSPGQAWVQGSPGNLPASWETRLSTSFEGTAFLSKGRGMASDANGNLFLIGDVVDWTNPGDNTFYSGTRVGLLRLVP